MPPVLPHHRAPPRRGKTKECDGRRCCGVKAAALELGTQRTTHHRRHAGPHGSARSTLTGIDRTTPRRPLEAPGARSPPWPKASAAVGAGGDQGEDPDSGLRGASALRGGAQPPTALIVKFIDEKKVEFGVEPVATELKWVMPTSRASVISEVRMWSAADQQTRARE